MDYWDGGKMAYMNARFALAHLVKNYQLMFDHGIRMQGSYLDVFGYVPPTEDFNPEHPVTRTDSWMPGRSVSGGHATTWASSARRQAPTGSFPYVDYSLRRECGPMHSGAALQSGLS